jgi:hypothetical protein
MTGQGDYVLWGRVEQIGIGQFAVIVTVIRATVQDSRVWYGITTSLAEGRSVRDAKMREFGDRVRAEGGRIVDVEDDG